MTSPLDLHTALVARLQTLPNITLYDGQVPDDVPAEPVTGRVYPYAVVWGAPGFTDLTEMDLGDHAHGALDWPVQVTVAAGDLTWCLRALAEVRSIVEGARLIPAAGILHEEPGNRIETDRSVAPVRFYAPLLFRTKTA